MSIPPLPSGLLQLLWFVRIVEAGSFAEAARRAGTTTSSMSKAVSRFEKAHGVRLLHRTTHSLSLTDEGDRLLVEGRRLISELAQAENLLADLGNGGASGRVRIAAPAAFARRCIMPELPVFLRTHQGIQIELQFGDDIADLAARGIDIAIRAGELGGWPGYVSRELYRFPWIACASPDYLQRHGIPDTPSALSSHALIGFRNKATGQIDNWHFTSPATGDDVRHIPRAEHVFDDGEMVWEMVRAGFGICWAPSWLGLDDLRSGRVVEILKEWRTDASTLSAVRLQRRLTPRRTQIVMDFIAALPSSWQV
ncbi:LysR family transcriptional regulator [Sodalis sp. RH15]|uniref:LysR family transcriptional regulator n=1 Tax=Sodalis sp. RH15 TaxID=3394330 RepID=UPI0039B511C5